MRGRGPGQVGTVTAKKGNVLTLRTFRGTETVDTTSTTTYHKEMSTSSLSAVSVGDVIRVRQSGPPAPGSKPADRSVTAKSITIVVPSVLGRVVAVHGGTLTLVGRDGKLFSVTTSSSTRYFHGRKAASSSSVKVGRVVLAEGTRDGTRKLSAGAVIVLPAHRPRPAPGGPPAHPAASGAATGTASGAPSGAAAA